MDCLEEEEEEESVWRSTYLQVLEEVQAHPIGLVSNDTDAHVGRGVVQITEQIHGLLAAPGPQLGVQLLGPPHLVRGILAYRGAAAGGKKRFQIAAKTGGV